MQERRRRAIFGESETGRISNYIDTMDAHYPDVELARPRALGELLDVDIRAAEVESKLVDEYTTVSVSV